MESFDQLMDFIRSMALELPSDYHLVLDVEEKMDDKRYWCGYYFVNRLTQSVFWLEKADISELFVDTKSVVTPSRISEFKSLHCTHVLT